MRKYTPEERQAALEMASKQGVRPTAEALRMPMTTLCRWRRDAELKALIQQATPPAEETKNPEQLLNDLVGIVQEEAPEAAAEEVVPAEMPEPVNQQSSDKALVEALATIDALQQENSKLIEVIQKLRKALKGLVEVV